MDLAAIGVVERNSSGRPPRCFGKSGNQHSGFRVPNRSRPHCRTAYDDWSSAGGKASQIEPCKEPVSDQDQEICLCFHVTRRKIENFIRLEQPRRAAQLSECFGAGTGCGWCRRYLIALFESAQADGESTLSEVQIPVAADYAKMRRHYRKTLNSDSAAPDPPDSSP